MRTKQSPPPLRLILKEFDELTLEEEDLYFLDTFCKFCSRELTDEEYEEDKHWCASKQCVKAYFKEDLIGY